MVTLPKMIVREIDPQTYNDFLAHSSGVTVFHSLEWLRIVQRGFNVDVKLMGVSGEDGQLCAVCPLEYKGPAFFRIWGSPLPRTFTPYQGIVWLSGLDQSVKISTIQAVVKQIRAPYLRIEWEPHACDGLTYEALKQACTPIIDLTVGEDELLRRMKGETRNQIRQAFRRGVEVTFVQEEGDWIHEYMKLSESTYRRQGLESPMKVTFLKALFARDWVRPLARRDSLSEGRCQSGRAIAVLASVNGEIIAASLIVLDTDTVYYLDNVSLREHQKYRANNAIMWSIIQWAARAGFRTYDLVGANVPSIAAFKFGFGAVRESYSVLTSLNTLGSLAYSISRFGRRVVQRIRRCNPGQCGDVLSRPRAYWD